MTVKNYVKSTVTKLKKTIGKTNIPLKTARGNKVFLKTKNAIK